MRTHSLVLLSPCRCTLGVCQRASGLEFPESPFFRARHFVLGDSSVSRCLDKYKAAHFSHSFFSSSLPSSINTLSHTHSLSPLHPFLNAHLHQHKQTTYTTMSLAKQNFSSASEEAINHQISQELQASQALPGLEKFFRESAEEEREHAQKLINYQNRRGGKVILQTLQAPESDWSSARNAIESTLQLEKDVNKSLLNLHKVAEENNDPQLCDFIESTYLEEQVEAIKKIADLVTQLNRVGGDGLGLYLWDQNLLKQEH
ncbi:unnamed protein product [Mortierella alpina]